MTGEEDPLARVAQLEELIDQLAEFWRGHPYLRLGQIISNATRTAVPAVDLFTVSDEKLLGLVADLQYSSRKEQ